MSKEFPIKNDITISPFILELYQLKNDLEELVKEMEEIVNE